MFFYYFASNTQPSPSLPINSLPLLHFCPHYPFDTLKQDSCAPINSQPISQGFSQQADNKRVKQIEKRSRKRRRENFERDSKEEQRKNEEYFPIKREKKKYKKIYQNTYRNVLPNILHLLFCFIQKKSKSGPFVQKYFKDIQKQENQELFINRFYCYHRLFKERMGCSVNYRSINHLMQMMDPSCAIYSKEEQIAFIKVNRILVNHFLSKELVPIILTSKRMKKQNRKSHFQKRRILLSKIQADFTLNL